MRIESNARQAGGQSDLWQPSHGLARARRPDEDEVGDAVDEAELHQHHHRGLADAS
ncbi:hypothetical protein [Enhygromyxa salina]|uniref:hypothetical protein n=1 Tax=Enhygromyxa salina TaxID=215803 RepID=UPI001969FDA7|nr:hypothetical protein [Enhygromyxa salina]